jgi:hypothetical protein
MTETPDPTRELDMSEVDADTETESELREEDIVEGEPGWDDGGDVPEDRAPDESAATDTPIARPGPAPDGRIAGEPGGRV